MKPSLKSSLIICLVFELNIHSRTIIFDSEKNKNYLRNRMNNERLTDLALLSVHYGNVSFSPEQVLDVMASVPRKLVLL